MGLAKLFGVKIGYLFAHELSVINEKPEAYWRWYDDNKRKKEEIERGKAIMEIYDELREKPHLITFMKVCMRLTEQQREKVLLLLEEKAANNKAPCPPGDGATNTEPGGMDADWSSENLEYTTYTLTFPGRYANTEKERQGRKEKHE